MSDLTEKFVFRRKRKYYLLGPSLGLLLGEKDLSDVLAILAWISILSGFPWWWWLLEEFEILLKILMKIVLYFLAWYLQKKLVKLPRWICWQWNDFRRWISFADGQVFTQGMLLITKTKIICTFTRIIRSSISGKGSRWCWFFREICCNLIGWCGIWMWSTV